MTESDTYRSVFVEEAKELLAELDESLLALEDTPDDMEMINRTFRAMHTLKGSGSMFGFDEMAAFTHDLESVFDLVRNGEMQLDREILDASFASRDHIQLLMSASLTGEVVDESISDALRGVFRRRLEQVRAEAASQGDAAGDAPGDGSAPRGSSGSSGGAPKPEAPQRVMRIRFAPSPGFFASGSNPLFLLDDLRELGELQVVADLSAMPSFEDMDPEACYAQFDLILTTEADEDTVRNVFLFVEDDARLDIQTVESVRSDLPAAGVPPKLGEILVARGDAKLEDIEQALAEQRPIGELLLEAGVAQKSQIDSALAEQQAIRQVRSRVSAGEADTSVRVAADKLDAVVDLVGELIIVQSRIGQALAQTHDTVLGSLSEELERLSNELRDTTLKLRMLPIGTIYGKLKRLVRDLSRELGKEVSLSTFGAETELDKTVIEKLGDPLVHILRNSIDHGIEPPDVREAKGKPREGVIELSAEHSGGEVVIRVTDDGRGMDIEALMTKARERGLVAPDAELSEREAAMLIFSPGFSTAKQVTSVSGRGVGMDVVKRAIDTLRGSITLDNRQDRGLTLSIGLPLTLAIIEGLRVRVGDEHFVLPLSDVEECVEIAHATDERSSIINLRGEAVPLVRLRECLEAAGQCPPIEQAVIVEAQGSRLGVVVDEVVGQHQTVIKSLGHMYRQVKAVSGATIQGDGSLALILDVAGLYHLAMGSRQPAGRPGQAQGQC